MYPNIYYLILITLFSDITAHIAFEISIFNFIVLCESDPYISTYIKPDGRSQRPRGLRCRSAAARVLRSWVRIPPGTWIFVCCECCVLSGRSLCNELITRPEESYQLWCVVVCDLKTSRMERT
jgi:hypothetical protein